MAIEEKELRPLVVKIGMDVVLLGDAGESLVAAATAVGVAVLASSTELRAVGSRETIVGRIVAAEDV